MKVLVDMSATLLHHGHIRLLKAASELGEVVVALTSDEEVLRVKGYTPELSFNERAEILSSIKYVSKVVQSPWLIDEEFIDSVECSLLIHGEDNSNLVSEEKVVTVKRTEGISSSDLRGRAAKIIESGKGS
jgi:glycerol-3-phosphate cytidylyltransferase